MSTATTQETALEMIDRIGARVVPHANPCPSRREWQTLRDLVEPLLDFFIDTIEEQAQQVPHLAPEQGKGGPIRLHDIAPRLAKAQDQARDLDRACHELLRVWDSDEVTDWQPGVLTATVEAVRLVPLSRRDA